MTYRESPGKLNCSLFFGEHDEVPDHNELFVPQSVPSMSDPYGVTHQGIDSVKACIIHHGHFAKGHSGEAVILLRFLIRALLGVHSTSGGEDHEEEAETMGKQGIDRGVIDAVYEVGKECMTAVRVESRTRK